MKTVADVLKVSRSNLAERLSGRSKTRGPYHKTDDADLLPAIRRLVDARPTYGYRRIAALLNRERRAADQPVVNAKRVHRIMGNNAMLLEKHTAVRKGRIHDGKVMVMRSNLRWCSDGLEFTSWNGDIVRLAFIIDPFDREIIAWTAVANAGISGSDVRDMMLEAVEKRFGSTRAPQAIEHLRQWFGLHWERDQAFRSGDQPDALLHAGRQPAVQRHVGSLRQNTEAGLYPHLTASGRRNRAPANRWMDRGLQ
jgi:putative transposase